MHPAESILQSPLPLLLLAHMLLQVVALGITNQRETTVVWSRSSGEPLHNAIVWLDNRTRCCCVLLDGSAFFRSLGPSMLFQHHN